MSHSRVVTLGSAVIYVAAAGIVVVEVLSVHSVIYREIHIQSSICSTCPEKIRGHDRHLPVAKSGTSFVESTIGIPQVSRREHNFFFFYGRSVAGRWSKKRRSVVEKTPVGGFKTILAKKRVRRLRRRIGDVSAKHRSRQSVRTGKCRFEQGRGGHRSEQGRVEPGVAQRQAAEVSKLQDNCSDVSAEAYKFFAPVKLG